MVAVYIPPLNVSGEDVANVLAAVGEQSDKPLVSSFLGAEGIPELLRVPDVAGSTAGRGSVPSYPAVEAAVRALARVVEYAVWLRTPDGPPPDPASVDLDAARQLVNEVLGEHPDGRGAAALAGDRAARRLRHRALGGPSGRARWRRRPRPARSSAGTSCSRRPPSHLRERPDLAHVWRNIDGADRDGGGLGRR